MPIQTLRLIVRVDMNKREINIILKALLSCKTKLDSDSHRFYTTEYQVFDKEKVKEALEILNKYL